ncbi:MAG: hypothetical protein QM729_21265 [Solirubrobacterales bacterium]
MSTTSPEQLELLKRLPLMTTYSPTGLAQDEHDALCALLAEREALVAELTNLREWPCEGRNCEHSIGAIETAPSGDEPPSEVRPYWFCGNCWGDAQQLHRADLARVTAERNAANALLRRWSGCYEGKPMTLGHDTRAHLKGCE